MTFGCHCDYIRADNLRIITDEDYCEVQEDISATVEIKHTVNLAYISSYFSEEQLQHLTADLDSNESVNISLPKLDMEGDAWEVYLARDEKGHMDMDLLINRTKQDAKSYDSLAHYLYKKVVA